MDGHRGGRPRARGTDAIPSATALGTRINQHSRIRASKGEAKQKVGMRLGARAHPRAVGWQGRVSGGSRDELMGGLTKRTVRTDAQN